MPAMKKHAIRHPIYTLLLIFVSLASCNGQVKSPVPSGQQPPNEQLAPLDPAAQISEYVVEVFEDKKGNLWFGTMSDGAARYDGKTLTYFSTKNGLCDNTVASIAEDKAGNIWFGTHNGASKFDGNTFVNFGIKEGLHGAGCNILVARDGNIWAGTNDGAFRFNGFSFVPFNIPNPVIENPSYKWVAGKVWSLMEDTKGNIWFARDGLGACKFDGTTFSHFTLKDGLCSNNVSSIVEDKQGNIWFGSLSSDFPKSIKAGGLSRYDGSRFINYPELEGLHENDIYSIYSDKKGNIWIGATGLGVYRYDGKSFKLYKGTDRMDLTWSMGIQSILEDRNGMLWFGFSGGLFRFDGAAIVNVTRGSIQGFQTIGNEPIKIYGPVPDPYLDGQISAYVRRIFQDKNGNLWFGTNFDGVCRYDGKSLTYFTTTEGFSGNAVRGIIADESGNLWFATDGGVCRYDISLANQPCNNNTCNHNQTTEKDLKEHSQELAKSFTRYTTSEGLSHNGVWSILMDKTGNFWFGTEGGVSCYNSGLQLFSSFQLPPIDAKNFSGDAYPAPKLVSSLYQDKAGNIWLGTNGNGVYRYDGKTLFNLSEQNGLCNNYVQCILEDKRGMFWFGSRFGGLSRYDPVQNKFTNFTSKDGLGTDFVWTMLEDGKSPDGTVGIWISTSGGGLSRYESAKGGISKLNKSPSHVQSIFEDKQGNLWLGCSGGLYRLEGQSYVNVMRTGPWK